MFIDPLEVDITSEDFNLDEDSDLQIGMVFVSGTVTADTIEIETVTAEVVVVTREDATVSMGVLDLLELVTKHKEYANLKILCENALEDAYRGLDPSEAAGDFRYDLGKGE